MELSGESKILAGVVGAALFLAARKWQASRGTNVGSLPKPAGGSWLWGHEKEAWFAPNCGFFIDNFEKLGHTFMIKAALFHPDILVISDPGAVTRILLKDTFTYRRGNAVRTLTSRLMGRSLFWTEAELHKHQKEILSPIFTHDNLKGMTDEVYKATDRLAGALREYAENAPSALRSGKGDLVNIDIMNWTWAATLDIIGAVGFGHDFEFGKSEDAKAIHRSWRDMIKLDGVMAGFMAPLVLRACPWIVNLPFKAIQAPGETRMIIQRLAMKIVHDRKKLDDGGELKGKDILSTCMRMLHGEDFQALLDHITAFVLAGYETSSTATNYTIYALAHNKEWQDRLRKELTEFQSSNPKSASEPTYEEYLTQLPILDAICKEGLRYYPPPEYGDRIVHEDDVIALSTPVKNPRTGEEVKNIYVKKGQTVYFSWMSMNRSKAVWGPDADQFKPERWLPESLRQPGDTASPLPTLQHGWSGLFTFGYGNRMCTGYRFAVFEYKVLVAELIKAFEFLPTERSLAGPEIELHTSTTTLQQPFAIGEQAAGPQLPVRIRAL